MYVTFSYNPLVTPRRSLTSPPQKKNVNYFDSYPIIKLLTKTLFDCESERKWINVLFSTSIRFSLRKELNT